MTTEPAQHDIVAIPLEDGSFGLAQVTSDTRYCSTYLIFANRFTSPAAISANLDRATQGPISHLELDNDAVECGEWPIVGRGSPRGTFPNAPYTSASVSYSNNTAANVIKFYNRGSRIVVAEFFQKYILPGVAIPADSRPVQPEPHAARLMPASLIEAAADGSWLSAPAAVAGPAEISVKLLFEGSGTADAALIRRIEALEQNLDASPLAAVVSRGTTHEFIDVSIRTFDWLGTMMNVEASLEQLKLADESLVEFRALARFPPVS